MYYIVNKNIFSFTLLPSLTATAIPVSSIFISDNSTIEFSPIEIALSFVDLVFILDIFKLEPDILLYHHQIYRKLYLKFYLQ